MKYCEFSDSVALHSKRALSYVLDDPCVKHPHHVAEGTEAGQGDSLSGVCSAVVVPQAGNEGSVPCCGVTFRVWEARRGCRNLHANSKVPKAER